MPAPRKSSPLKKKAQPEPPKPKLEAGDFIPPRRKRTMTEDKDETPKAAPAPDAAPPKTTPKITVRTTGTNAAPQPLLQPPSSPQAILNNLVCREVVDPSGPLEPVSETVTILQATVEAMAKGTDIAPFKDHITRVATNQPEKGDVIRSYMNQINHELIADLAIMRAHSMRIIKRASSRNDMSVAEALVVWRMCNEQLPDLQKGLGSDKAVDSVTVVEKIDYARQQAERITHREWDGTSPQGRELIRKKLWEVKREVQAKKAIVQEAAKPS